MRASVCPFLLVPAYVCVACLPACLCLRGVRACLSVRRACLCVCACPLVCVCASSPGYVRVSVRACVCACVRVCACVSVCTGVKPPYRGGVVAGDGHQKSTRPAEASAGQSLTGRV